MQASLSADQVLRLRCLELAVTNTSKHQIQYFELIADKYYKWITQPQGKGGRPKKKDETKENDY